METTGMNAPFWFGLLMLRRGLGGDRKYTGHRHLGFPAGSGSTDAPMVARPGTAPDPAAGRRPPRPARPSTDGETRALPHGGTGAEGVVLRRRTPDRRPPGGRPRPDGRESGASAPSRAGPRGARSPATAPRPRSG